MLIIKKKFFQKMTNNYKKMHARATSTSNTKNEIKHKPSTIFQDQREYLHDDLKNMFLIPREHYS